LLISEATFLLEILPTPRTAIGIGATTRNKRVKQ